MKRIQDYENIWHYITDMAIDVKIGKFDELEAARKIMDTCVKLLQTKGVMVNTALKNNVKEYPILLSATHVAEICSCHRATAYAIMKDPHRPIWRNGSMVRLHRDLFFAQLEEESMPKKHNS